ncbi:siderophore-interacting protein [Rosenbergiella collisarenosi]|uniref:siderophore-interacting protein n=1 Tax=Rosenbergiella collisarenosi TaxID=1544695 RepID=UPI001BDB6410|nr:siderophore-interacting protein [Rosenbergiella collisarenosi]MBT0721767.1 siderophore-interacting protein [Rosenbergiella collisarenosi]
MASGYRVVDLQLKRREMLSPSLLRCVFTGKDIREIKHEAPDQRIKLLLAEHPECQKLPVTEDWYSTFLAIPKAQRPTMRTYTLRHLDTTQQELWVDVVLHGDSGPASRWAQRAQVDSPLQVVVPNAQAATTSGGFEWFENPTLQEVLLIADETALPAAMGILENLAQRPNPPRVQAFLHVPLAADIQPLYYDFAKIHWSSTELEGDAQQALLHAVQSRLTLPDYACSADQSLEEHSLSDDILWERAAPCERFRTWVAAESSVVRTLRRYLIQERMLTRETATFMAYWSQGKVTG